MSFTFVQFTDLHLGEGQADSLTAFREMVQEINALKPLPEFVIHTGDIRLRTRAWRAGAIPGTVL